ncbi:hypothetical protein vBDshSR4C_027 [Dinoroseobacter phage vB_DshS-R4C]|nr:hypothetical protein vBDshSR4C_027 [Dinoroseobacter phage vB_DshS-R4C]
MILAIENTLFAAAGIGLFVFKWWCLLAGAGVIPAPF